MNWKKVLVCGGRDFSDQEFLNSFLDALVPDCHTIIEGEATGADTCAKRWGLSRNKIVHSFFADWEKYGRSAGPRRNSLMLLEGQPDVVIAFPGGRGTDDMIKRARKANISTIILHPYEPR